VKLLACALLTLLTTLWAANGTLHRGRVVGELPAPRVTVAVGDRSESLLTAGTLPVRREVVHEPDSDAPCASLRHATTGAVPSGVCQVRIVVPTDVCVHGHVALFEVAPALFIQHGDPRLLADTLDEETFEWDPLAAPDERDVSVACIDATSAELVIELELDDAPLGAPLWLLAWSTNEDVPGAPSGFAPVVHVLPPIESLDDGVRARLELAPLGGVRGLVVVDRAPAADGAQVLAEQSVGEQQDALIFVEVRDRESGLWGEYEEGRFALWPLADGPHEIEASAELPGRAHRFVATTHVRAGRMHDLGELRLGAADAVIELQARDESGEPLDGEFELGLAGWSSRAIDDDEAGRLVLHGEWSELTFVRFLPRESDVYESVSLPLVRDRAPRTVVLVAPGRARTQRSFILTALAPEGRRLSTTALAFVAQATDAPWREVHLGFDSGGCVRQTSSPFDPGRYELVAWLPCCALSYVGPFDVPELTDGDGGGERRLELPFVRSGTRVRGTVRGTYRGLDVDWYLGLTVTIRCAAVRRLSSWRDPALLRVADRHTIELDGLPANVDLELVLCDEVRPLQVIPLHLAVGELLDLGELVVAHE
jgi:hypothetical protein